MADEMVLETQKWLNTTYGNVSGFGSVTEDGITGWGTVYGLIRGLQHELGITGLVDNFGPGTASAFDKIASTIKVGYTANPNIVYIIQGGFWCKGITPGAFDGKFTSATEDAIIALKMDAGLSDTSAVLDSNFMKALLAMDAFVLTANGSDKVRSMQQWLNNRYAADMGIMPCDGVYQRQTNTALIYALQRVEGQSASAADGIYGANTGNLCPTLSQGGTNNSDAVRILQYGLLVNGYSSITISGTFDEQTQNYVNLFCSAMNLDPLTPTLVGNRVIKGLLTSNGDTSRTSLACDTSKQLTASDVAKLKDSGYQIVGRYLTGLVGTGADARHKNLTTSEIETITAGGLSIFPIFQSGGAEAGYFTLVRGYADATLAIRTARQLGFAPGTTIYFACDVDIQEAQIDATVGQYVSGLNNAFSAYEGNEYQIGLYGTRNVCSHAWTTGFLAHLFVSDMSTGYSGNLGFAMPTNWSYDQYFEETLINSEGDELPVDRVAVDVAKSDPGCAEFTPNSLSNYDRVQAIWPILEKISSDPANVEFEKEYPIVLSAAGVSATWSLTEGIGSGNTTVSIKNGSFDSVKFSNQIAQVTDVDESAETLLEQAITRSTFEANVTSKVKAGSVEFEASGDITGTLTLKLALHLSEIFGQEDTTDDLPVDLTLNFTFKFDSDFWNKNNFNINGTPQKVTLAVFSVLSSTAEIAAVINILKSIGEIAVEIWNSARSFSTEVLQGA